MADDDLQVTFGPLRFDPLEAQPDLGKDDEPGERDRALSWFVQFRRPLTTAEVAAFRKDFGLRLTEFVPAAAYLERISTATAARLVEEPVVRAVARLTAPMKQSSGVEKRADDEPQRLNVVLFPDVDPAEVVRELSQEGAPDVVVLDQRGHGGWLTLQLDVAGKDLDRITALEGVRWVEPVPVVVDDEGRAGPAIAPPAPASQQRMFAALWGDGLNGAGQVVGVLDNGPADLDHCFFSDATADPGPGHRKVIVLRNATSQDPGPHATFVAGCVAGDQEGASGKSPSRGGAWAARLAIGNRRDMAVFGNPRPATASTLLAELRAAAAAGARVHSNSWHARPTQPGHAAYDLMAAEVDTFAWTEEDHLVVASSGNTGEQQGAPGIAKNVLCVAAASDDGPGAHLGDGAAGPTADGRRKPDLMTVGCGITSALVGTGCEVGPRARCASSWATPLAAAAAALVRQALVEGRLARAGVPAGSAGPSGALLRALLVHACVRTDGMDAHPSDSTGWGLLQLQQLLLPEVTDPAGAGALRLWDVRHADGLTTDEAASRVVRVADAAVPLKAILAWSDAPGVPGAARSLVNDLDLEVVGPRGDRFRGNALQGGRSVAGGPADGVNTVEVVLVDNPEPGEWTVLVTAREVNVGNPRQGYAVVLSGRLAEGGEGPPTP